MTRILFVLSLLWPMAAFSQTAADSTARYALYVLGVQMAVADIHLVYNPGDYRMDLRLHTTGAATVFYDGHQDSDVAGNWQADGPLPAILNSTGTWNGDLHRLVISFAGGAPVVTTLIPPDRKKREPIPPEKLRDAIDIPSAIVALVRQVAITGSCDRSARTFDGRRLSEIVVHNDGEERLPPSDRSSFSGLAKRCRFDIRQINGFDRDDDKADARQTKHATAWLARLTPDGPMLPVRIDLEARYVGQAQILITDKGK